MSLDQVLSKVKGDNYEFSPPASQKYNEVFDQQLEDMVSGLSGAEKEAAKQWIKESISELKQYYRKRGYFALFADFTFGVSDKAYEQLMLILYDRTQVKSLEEFKKKYNAGMAIKKVFEGMDTLELKDPTTGEDLLKPLDNKIDWDKKTFRQKFREASDEYEKHMYNPKEAVMLNMYIADNPLNSCTGSNTPNTYASSSLILAVR